MIATKIVQLKYEAGRAGLWRTMHALEEAVKAVGWELAEKARFELLKHAEIYYRKHKNEVDNIAKTCKSFEGFAPSSGRSIKDWEPVHWSWFLKQRKEMYDERISAPRSSIGHPGTRRNQGRPKRVSKRKKV